MASASEVSQRFLLAQRARQFPLICVLSRPHSFQIRNPVAHNRRSFFKLTFPGRERQVHKLDFRLTAAAEQIRSTVHADVGSDHAGLLTALIRSGRISRGIAIEKHQQPYENSKHTLANYPAEARLGDGLAALAPGEADSLSITGMGAENMVTILQAFPNRVPDYVVLQPNQTAEPIRAWALDAGFHLQAELIARGHRNYPTLTFRRADLHSTGRDAAYDNVDREAGLMFGPLIIKRMSRIFQNELREEEAYWSKFSRLNSNRARRLNVIRRLLNLPPI
ncbi:MAG: tRNA (adenine22-N1)-methyltransferase [Mariniblastus sp.]|jgi:tRNA (adenine22-N1)-methyltransferase